MCSYLREGSGDRAEEEHNGRHDAWHRRDQGGGQLLGAGLWAGVGSVPLVKAVPGVQVVPVVLGIQEVPGV